MTRKDCIDVLLEKLPEEKKREFVSELQKTETKTGRDELVKQYMSEFSQGEIEFSLEDPNDSVLSDEMMDEIIGGQEGRGVPIHPMYRFMGEDGG